MLNFAKTDICLTLNFNFQCETLLEQNEADIEDWYFKHQGDISLQEYLCKQRALKNTDTSCLNEQFKGEIGNNVKEEL